ncbi:type II secretion system F family protein [Corynebacterium sp. HMSC29G08]|uniref:type II secretion system F family protein n=1 Tax=Corynebacterium sp. HMSC29G08 TaxID=1581069 RepID=UPI000B18821B|nr:type II secretion system F family protein [Corynebacterium sp. HMSC29G08]
MSIKVALLCAAALALHAPSPASRVNSGPGRSWSPGWIPVGVGAVSLVAFSVGRAGVVIAAAMAAAVVVYTLQERRNQRLQLAGAQAAATFIGHLAEGVSAGATMADAAARAAERLPSGVPRALLHDVSLLTSFTHQGSLPPTLTTPELERVACLWRCAQTRGVPIASLLATARDEIDTRLQHRAATDAALTGPKTTATMLSLLPLGGIAMGSAMGANPIGLLLGPGLGSVLLLVGTALVCGGVLASGAIIRRAAA